jgi:uncharacterized protein YecT (DUF1311 family)
MKWLVVLSISLFFGSLACGQDATTNPDDETQCCCTTYDTSVCLSTILKKVDQQLNNNYQKALTVAKKYTPQDEQNLKTAQRAWTSYRDAACKAEYGLWGGGSGGPNAHAMCIIRLTKERNIDLQNAYLQER